MADASISILLQLDGIDEHPAGRASLPDGTTRDFHGWLGLLEALDVLAAVAAGASPIRSVAGVGGSSAQPTDPSHDGRRRTTR